MRHEILYSPSYSLLRVELQAGENVVAEPGAMVSMSGGVDVETKARGGLLGGLKRTFLGGESFFLNTFRADQAGEVTFAPPVAGDVMHLRVEGQPVLAQSGAFLAGSTSIEIDNKWGGARGFFSGAGLILLKLTGNGDVWVSAYGAIHLKTLAAGERYVVDTGHIVAFDASAQYSVRRVGGIKSTLFSGEGLVADFVGPGRVWLQTRSPEAFLGWLGSNMPDSTKKAAAFGGGGLLAGSLFGGGGDGDSSD
jgi:uncharacterized protein (TIGR00266 family)